MCVRMDVYIKAILEGTPLWSVDPACGNAPAKYSIPNSTMGSTDSKYRTSFEERQAALVDRVLESTGNAFENHGCSRMLCTDLSEMQLQQYTPQLLNAYGLSSCNLAPQQQQVELRNRQCSGGAEAGDSRDDSTDSRGWWQRAVTNQFLAYDSLPDLLEANDQQQSSVSTGTLPMRAHNYQFSYDCSLNESANSTNLMTFTNAPAGMALDVNGVSVKNTNTFLQRVCCLQNTVDNSLPCKSQILESLARSCINEPSAKRQRASCYTLDDIPKNLSQDAARCNANCSGLIIGPEASLRVSSSPSSCTVRPETHSEETAKSVINSIERQSIAARHRRKKISERIRSLEKLIPGCSKLDTARMLEEAIKYVRFLQAQVRALERMSDSRDCSDPSEQFMTACLALRGSSARRDSFDHKRFITNAYIGFQPYYYSLAISLLNKLSTQQTLHILVTSPIIQRKLYSAELCVYASDQRRLLAGTEAALRDFQ